MTALGRDNDPVARHGVPSQHTHGVAPAATPLLFGCNKPESSFESADEIEPLLHQPRHKKSLAHRLAGLFSERPAQIRIFDKLDDARCGLLHAIDNEAVFAVTDLMPDSSRIAAYDTRPFPHCLADGQAKSFADRLLQAQRLRAAAEH